MPLCSFPDAKTTVTQFCIRSWQSKYGLKYPYILLSVMGIVSSCSLSPARGEHIYYPGWFPKYPQKEAVLREPNRFSSSTSPDSVILKEGLWNILAEAINKV